ncbi:hypothetical protein DYBT9623_04437 [Dyadobacter sp. CECT 9623]|uniref:Uncharacterized protein n=1 Tax=Dyadobacter linearis TaxID=2823330 RepID=A0ABN7RFW0_9BACT|nr:hypothetical protein [Dyadobacter sp. CECT 9623]CAG5072899.1 hypothetical protein DYBT9623_04437 [Dyadobacter sp. CECT 9623]
MKYQSKGKIYPIKWSLVSHDTNFMRYLFENSQQWYSFKCKNRDIIQTAWIRLTPVVDQHGSLFNPMTPVIFILN